MDQWCILQLFSPALSLLLLILLAWLMRRLKLSAKDLAELRKLVDDHVNGGKSNQKGGSRGF
jgi:hypothetical protein